MSAPGISAAGPYQRRATAVVPGSVITRFVAAKVQSLGARDFSGIAATDALCPQDNVALVMAGGGLSRLQTLSWDHRVPIGRITRAWVTAHELLFNASFAPKGVDEEIDSLCAKVKAGVPMDISLQFVVSKGEPIDPRNSDAGVRAIEWEALEIALVLVGADPGARITARKSRRSGVPPMQTAISHCETALEEHRAFGRHHQEIADAAQRLDEQRSRLGTALRGLHTALEAGDQEQAAEHHARCMRCLGGVHREMRAIGDRHDDATDAVNAVHRALRSAGDVLDLGDEGEPIAGSTDDQHGRSADFRRRQCELLRLATSETGVDQRQGELEELRRIGQGY
jgi:hypothetical protein